MTNSDGDAMEIDTTTAQVETDNADVDEEEACSDLLDLLESAEVNSSPIPILSSILTEPHNRYGSTATGIKERAIYALSRAYCAAGKYDEVVNFLTGSTCGAFFENVTKAKCAKVVRGVLDAVCAFSPNELDMVSILSSSRNLHLS